jgi:poly-beta-1,6-N-acetyl-D-glucosamine synthase
MFNDWYHWLSSLRLDELVSFAWGLLLVDGLRYGLAKIVMCVCDFACDLRRWLCGRDPPDNHAYCPTVGVILAGYNEAEHIESTLRSIWGSYPRLKIVVVDDGSEDNMAERVRSFARNHAGVLALRRPRRSGKSSAMNFALQYLDTEVVVVADADSDVSPDAIWRMVQPLADPRVGAVSATILGRHPFAKLVTWLQSYEYLSSIFVGRLLAARLGILGIVSGAFGAFRREALDAIMGWDVGPPEDLDLTLAIRKAGYDITFAPYAVCHTDLPGTWYGLARQRLRWDQSGVIRNHCRKHLDMACFWHKNFRLSDLLLLVETWFTNIVCLIGIWVWIGWLLWTFDDNSWRLILTIYLCYTTFEAVQALSILYYSDEKLHDALICLVVPLAPVYQFLLMVVRTWALLRETFFRSSYHDNFVPLHVREATWRW